MFIEVRGNEYILNNLSKIFGDLLRVSGYTEGPRFATMDTGNLMNYAKGPTMVSVQLREEESEMNETVLRVESEVEVPELYDLWDSALIVFGKKMRMQLLDFAVSKQKVERGIR